MSQSHQVLDECQFPRCTAANGQPELVEDGLFCRRCKRRYRNLIDWLAEDYIHVRELPLVARADDERLGKSARSKEFGHPAEWASDTMRELADKLNWVEDSLRDSLGHSPPVHPGVAERYRVRDAHRYLTSQFEQLCVWHAAPDEAEELGDLHHKIRRGIGQTKKVRWLEGIACPGCEAEELYHTTGQVSCSNCGETTTEERFQFFLGVVADDIDRDLDRWLQANPGGRDTPVAVA